MKPPANVERPKVLSVPDTEVLPLPPGVVSTKNNPFLNVVVLNPMLKPALEIRVEETLAFAVPPMRIVEEALNAPTS
jgi:hypothetical protein